MDPTARLLADYLNHLKPHPGIGPDTNPLFSGPHHTRLTRSGVTKILARHVRAVRARDPGWAPGLPVTAHTLRRSRAMHLIQAGVNLIYIRDLLGHADVSTTEIYARADAETKRKAIENAYQPLTPDVLPDWTSDTSLVNWLDTLGKWPRHPGLCGQRHVKPVGHKATPASKAHNTAVRIMTKVVQSGSAGR